MGNKKLIITAIACLALVFTLTGCGETVNVNIENGGTISGKVIGESALIAIGDGLYYDATTRVVYWWGGALAGYAATTPSPYYAPNGFPYRYNPETNTFEEVQNG